MATEDSPANAENLEPAFATRTIGSTEPDAGFVIGRYHLLQKIGEGGMGEVWLAEQKEPVRRRVALKLVKAGMDTREVVARFESERQALALMDHPAIAKVLDAGSTPQGAPYFVMEYVAGVPITTYCDNHRLSTRERLELFMRVCEGVQHAHQKAIIHRDLKPSNILVTEVDGHPAPKIIDFGVAKALTQKLTADTMFTRVGALVGTPEYMSPEQALSSGEDIDTRTDVYSLGIIFYELLAGVHPIDLRKVAFEEFLRRLREDDPPKLSTKFRAQDPATSTELARKRHTEPPALVKQMRGDLDSIALKALEKDRARRYGSPSDFALDIARYLNNEPVLAVPPSVAYRASKFARRLPRSAGHRLRLRFGADRCRRHQHPAEHPREQRSCGRPSGQRFSTERCAGASQRSQPIGAKRQARSRPEGADGARPRGSTHHWEVRPATGGGGVYSRHHRADVHGPRSVPGGTQAIGAGAGLAPAVAGGGEYENSQNHEPWSNRLPSGQICRI
jgi:non-specific serine/threonine protein kinase/serine/threonine-protein kinase